MDPLFWLLLPYAGGQPFFRNFCEKSNFYERHRMTCKKVMTAYNLLMCLFSLVCHLGMLWLCCCKLPNGLLGMDHFAEPTGWYKSLTFYFYISKYVEFLDTYFLILVGRPVTWLQFLHHLGAPIDMAYIYHSENDGSWIFVGFNGLIHTIMYYYYAACIMKWWCPFKQIITSMQLTQFFVGLCFVTVYPIRFPEEYWGNDMKRQAWLFNFGYIAVLITLFGNFYYVNYYKKKNASKKEMKDDDKNNERTPPIIEKKQQKYMFWFKGLEVHVPEKWLADHPGGTKVFKIFQNRDATENVLATHSEEAIKKITALARVPDGVHSDKQEVMEVIYNKHKKSPYTNLLAEAKEKKLFSPCFVNELFKAFYSYGSALWGIYLIVNGKSPYTGACFMAFGWFQLGWLGHDWSHHTILPHSNSYFCFVNDMFTWTSTILRGNTLLWWKLRHNTHHVVTNEVGNDPDIRVAPVYHFFEDFNPNFLQKWQHLYYVPTLTLLHIYWYVESWMVTVRHLNSKNKREVYLAKMDVVALLLHSSISLYLAVFHCGFLPIMLTYLISGFGTSIVVFSSHYGEERLDIDEILQKTVVDYGNGIVKELPYFSLFEETLRTTRNIGGFFSFDGGFWFHLTGGLSHQIEHHLFPMMPRCNLRYMSDSIKKAVYEYNSDHSDKKTNLEYKESSLAVCVALCMALLKENVVRNCMRIITCAGTGIVGGGRNSTSSSSSTGEVDGDKKMKEKIQREKNEEDEDEKNAVREGAGEHEAKEQKEMPVTKLEILINDRVYDITNFKHPGGSIIKFSIGTDATDAFRQFHYRSERAQKLLKVLPSREKTEKDKFYDSEIELVKDFRKLEQDLKSEGVFDPSYLHVAWRITELTLFFVIGHYLCYLDVKQGSNTSYVTTIFGLVLIGIFFGRCGWFMHEGGHYSLTGQIKIDRRIQEFFYGFGCGMSACWWRNQHNKHHAVPQKLEHDVDLATLPLIAFNKAVLKDYHKKNWILKMWLPLQAYLFAPITCLLVGLGWQLYLHARHSLRTKTYIEAVFMFLRYVAWYGFFTFFLGYSILSATGMYIFANYVGCCMIFVNFSVSHTHLDVVPQDEHRSWVDYSSSHTMNVASDYLGLTTWWMCYLNYQIEHHLWPSCPQFRFPSIAPRVKALFKKHGKTYKELYYVEALQVTFANLHDVGGEILNKTKIA